MNKYSKCGLGVSAALMCSGPIAAQNADDSAADSGVLQEVVITANRQAEPLSKVPISVTAFTQQQMDSQGLKDVDDLIRFTPGLNITRVDTGQSTVAIRGIASAAGSGTTGIYVDDTPIQVRNLGYGAGTAFPGLFDLERVEVLRGPQGTLFGAGSEGGTIRFIQTTPSLTDYSGYGRAEISNTQHGDLTYEGGAAFGGPLIDDRLGFRVSAYYRREGGYVDGVTGNFTVLDPSGASYGSSVRFDRTSVVREDTNWNRTTAFRAALKFAATDNLTITPSVSYQKQHVNDAFGSYWLSTSNVRTRDFSRPVFTAGNPSTNPALTPMDAPELQQGDDKFTLSALALNWRLGPVELISNTSYFDRDSSQWFDFTTGYVGFYLQAFGTPYPAGPGMKAMSVYDNGQQNFVQELRLQSTDTDSRLTWVAGAFYSHNKQTAAQPIHVNFIGNAAALGFSPDFAGFADGPPYGPGSSALENFLGIPLGPNSTVYTAAFETIEKQVAGFAQADFKLTPRLKATLGVRYSRNDLDFNAAYGGPETNGAAPFGLPCVPGTFCATPDDFVPPGTYPVGTGPFAPVFPRSAASSSENSFTPKVGLSYEIVEGNMVYATAAKGFRPGGASLRVPTVCRPDLDQFGYLDANGNSTQPEVYGSDSVWSYELGTKNRLFNGRLALDGSVYLIKWKSIQTRVFLPNCAYDFVDNLADATSKGFDLAIQAKPINSLTLGGTIGYSKPTFDQNALSPSGVTIYRKDGSIPDAGAPWTFSFSGQYDFSIFGDQKFYLRTDYTRTSELRRVGTRDSTAPNFNPLLPSVPAFSVVNARLGWLISGANVSLFVDNLTDARPDLSLTGGAFPAPQTWTSTTLRPRTFGLTTTYRF